MDFSHKMKSYGPFLAVLVVCALSYWGTLQAPFLAFEVESIVEDPLVRDFSRVNDIVRIDQVFNGSLPKLSFAFNYLLGQASPWGYHLLNLLIHLAVGLALWWVVREWVLMFGPRNSDYSIWLPLTASAIHLLHPLNTQAVILISSRPILLASLFYLLTFGFLSRFLRTYKEDPKKAKGSVDFLMVMACLAMGSTSSPVMVTVPFMGWIFYRFYISTSRIAGEIFGLALVPWIIYLIYQMTTPDAGLMAQASGKFGGVTALYFATQIKALIFYYLPKSLAPMHLNLDPDFKLLESLGDWSWILALIFIGMVMGLVRATRSRLVHWAFIWTFLIFLSFYGLGMDEPVVSEPRFYLPGMGLHLLLAMALVELGLRHPITGWLKVGVPALFMILTFARGQVYRSEISLWEETARGSPHKPGVHYELGKAYLKGGFPEKAEQQLITVLEIDPKFIPARIDLGKVYIERKEYAKALESYRALMQQGIKSPAVKFNAGLVLLKMNQPQKAIPYLEEAVTAVPEAADWHLTLARAYHKAERLNKAVKHYRLTLQINPQQPVAYNELGELYWELKSYYFADAAFQKAYQLDNHYVDALNNLATSSMLFKQYELAITYLNRLLEINPDDANARQMLDAAQRLKKQQAEQPPATPKDFH